MKFHNGMMLLLGGTLMVSAGCSISTPDDSSDKYNALVKNYNDLSAKYNSQTQRNVDNDRVIQAASNELGALDRSIDLYRKDLETVHEMVRSNECSPARSLIETGVKKKLADISTKANALSQGVLVKALDAMSDDLSSYKDDSKTAVNIQILLARTQVDDGMVGLKAFALSSHNQLIDDYNEKCAAKKTIEVPRVTEADARPVIVPRTETVAPDKVVTVDRSGKEEVITRDEMKERYRGTYAESAYTQFSEIAVGSGGYLVFSPTAEMFAKTVDVLFEKIMAASGDQTDIAIVLDTTSSMNDDIGNVKLNMGRLLEKLQTRAFSKGLKLSLVLYRDRGDEYVVQVAQDFNSDIAGINRIIQGVKVAGGGDEPEAMIDALETAMEKLSWRPSANRSVILIGDAPGHEKSGMGTSATTIVDRYKRAGLGIVIYPILVNR